MQKYIEKKTTKIVNTTCGQLFGSVIQLRCLDNSDSKKYLMECNDDGEWTGKYICSPKDFFNASNTVPDGKGQLLHFRLFLSSFDLFLQFANTANKF